MNIGRDVWLNAPAASSPLDELYPWLDEMRETALGWKADIKANEGYWESKIEWLVSSINAFQAEYSGDVFLPKSATKVYDGLCNDYQKLKDSFTMSKDAFMSQWQQDLADDSTILGKLSTLFDGGTSILAAGLRSVLGGAGVVIGGAIVIVIVYLYLKGRR